MKTLFALLLTVSAAPALAGSLGPAAPLTEDACLLKSERPCAERTLSLPAEPKRTVASPVTVSASNFRGPRGVPSSLLKDPNPEIIPKARATTHREASVSVGLDF